VTSSDRHTRLQAVVTGALAEEHRIALTDLATLASALQGALRNVGEVLSGGQAGTGGRKRRDVELATELALVASQPGSVDLEMELVEQTPALPGMDVDPSLGTRSLVTLIDGLASLDPAAESLPTGFDPGVLKAIQRIGPIVRKGMAVNLCVNGTVEPRRTTLDRQALASIGEFARRPVRAEVTLEGVLQMVDLAAQPLQCRIDRSHLPSVTCFFDASLEETARDALGHRVQVSGEGSFDAGASEPRRITVHEVERVTDVAGIDPEQIARHADWRELAAEQEVGPLSDPSALGGVFEDDDELDEFLHARLEANPA
jgi:hypothetical protein